MPRGHYDRSKIKKSNKVATVKATKTKPQKAMSSGPQLTEIIKHVGECVNILTALGPVPGTLPIQDKLLTLINHFVSQAVPTLPETSSVAQPVVAKQAHSAPAVGTVSYPPALTTSPVGLKLKKDGTPKQRPGPKKKTEVVAQARVEVPPNGNSDVFNPQHAS